MAARRPRRPARARTAPVERAPHPLTKLDRTVFARLLRAMEKRGLPSARARLIVRAAAIVLFALAFALVAGGRF